MVFAECTLGNGKQQLDQSEDIEVILLSHCEVCKWAKKNVTFAAKTWPVLLMYEQMGSLGMKQEPETFVDLLDSIHDHPGMYLGKKSITLFQSFMHGFQASERLYSIENNFDWDKFETYVSKMLHGRHDAIRSFGAALIRSGQDEEKAFDLWFANGMILSRR
jgi:hypothetical protein